jgi:hypothetical protein
VLRRTGVFVGLFIWMSCFLLPVSAEPLSCPRYDSVHDAYIACDGTPAGPDGPHALVTCIDTPEVPQPADGDPAWNGRTRSPSNPTGPRTDGQVVIRSCVTNYDEATTRSSRIYIPANPVVERLSDQEVAALAIAQLPIPSPAIGIGPDRESAAVSVPISLWIANPDPVSASATDGPLTVTVTAEISATSWSMGEPIALDRPGSQAAPVVCGGAGDPVADGSGKVTDCGYTYKWRSLPDRTHGSGEWTVTATATWAIAWTSTSGRTGTDTVSRSSVTGLSVGEWRSEIVVGPTR